CHDGTRVVGTELLRGTARVFGRARRWEPEMRALVVRDPRLLRPGDGRARTNAAGMSTCTRAGRGPWWRAGAAVRCRDAANTWRGRSSRPGAGSPIASPIDRTTLAMRTTPLRLRRACSRERQ